ncbi:hypothetical protein HW932_19895 [Allochromatium humboldtianum]|uniref:Uncharacterized protein n=1 Tax=Allochromatium humboldtianum TaxID=504901 RepID=A0A850RH57_9GAMM|nr:TraE/TraK family type IV conjugative transfer system protein [Allochromatium humboldtianum]NVZ11516.1 hypothetical protein [Allochromatium humboldtianum]
MNFKNALRSMERLQSLSIGMLASNVIMAGGLTYAIVAINNTHERLVIIPPHLDAQVEVAWSSANREYLKSFGLYVATLVGNIQPKSSTVVLDAVSAFMDPAIYTEFRRQALAIIQDPVFKTSGAVMTFQPSTIQFESETSRVFVTGSLITKSGLSQDKQKTVTYELGVRIREGRPWVSHFTSYEGSVIRTVAWHINNSAREGQPIPQHALPVSMRAPKAEAENPFPQTAFESVPVSEDASDER